MEQILLKWALVPGLFALLGFKLVLDIRSYRQSLNVQMPPMDLGVTLLLTVGVACPGDVAKAFAGGADFVMLGGMLAGHDEGGGEVITKIYETNEVTKTDDGFYESVYEEKQFVKFYGMSSAMQQMTKHFGGLKDLPIKRRKRSSCSLQRLSGYHYSEYIGWVA